MFDLKAYNSNIQMILGPHGGGERLMPLAPKEPLRGPGLNLLSSASNKQLLSGLSIRSEEYAHCVRSALFLYFSALEESHGISQGIASATGSFLHGIMHRQEPDFGNSRYWFRRVVTHDVYPGLRESVLSLLDGNKNPLAGHVRPEIESRPDWDPLWFVDQCEAAHEEKSTDFEELLMQIQLLEWQLLFDYCYRKAVRKK